MASAISLMSRGLTPMIRWNGLVEEKWNGIATGMVECQHIIQLWMYAACSFCSSFASIVKNFWNDI